MILRRETSAACSARGGSITSRSMPSTRKRTTERASYGSKWMSRRALAQRLQQQRVDHADDRRLVAGFEQVLDRRQVLHQAREVDVAREVVARSAPPPAPTPVVGARELGGEALGVDGRVRERPLQHAPQLGDAVGGRVGPRQHDDGVALVLAGGSTPCALANA